MGAYTSEVPIVSIRLDQFRQMPWKNGRGLTTEIARSPATGEVFDWRISTAIVSEDGPFSIFEGCDRVILVLEGKGIRLDQPSGGRSARLGPLEPWMFDGDAETNGTLVEGPIRDFNVMTRRAVAGARVRAVAESTNWLARSDSIARVLYCVNGDWLVSGGVGRLALPAGSAAIASPATDAFQIERSGPAGVVICVDVVLAGEASAEKTRSESVSSKRDRS